MKILTNKSYKLNGLSQVVLVGVFILLISSGLFSNYQPTNVFGKIASLIIILVFLLYSIVKGAKFSILHQIIILLFFLSSFFTALGNDSVCNKLCTISLISGMIGLAYIAIKNFKTFNYRSGVGFYLILVYFTNVVLIVVLFNALKANILDQFVIVFFVIKFFVLIILSFISFATYIEEGKKESILFLFMSFSFIFSQVMYYINTYYITKLSFDIMAKSLNIIGLYFIFQYIIETKKSKGKSNKDLILA